MVSENIARRRAHAPDVEAVVREELKRILTWHSSLESSPTIEALSEVIEKARDAQAQSRLGRRLRPFLLRRLKRHVAADLPAKLEQVSFCELTSDQRAVYQQVIEASVTSKMFRKSYSSVFRGDERWTSIDSPEGEMFAWDDDSTYIQNPPYFRGMTLKLPGIPQIRGDRCLAKLGDSITTDHISPAGSIKEESPAGAYLKSKGVQKADFNSYGSPRGNKTNCHLKGWLG